MRVKFVWQYISFLMSYGSSIITGSAIMHHGMEPEMGIDGRLDRPKR